VKRLKIAIVDDDDSYREIVRLHLEIDRHQVLEAADGLQGLEMIRKERPELVIADLNMPNLGGADMIEKLKVDDSCLGLLPCFILSGNIGETEKIRLLNCGVDHCFEKSISLSLLRAHVNASLTSSLRHNEFIYRKMERIAKSLPGHVRYTFPEKYSLSQYFDEFETSIYEAIESKTNKLEEKPTEDPTSNTFKRHYISHFIDVLERMRKINRSENTEMLGWWLILTVTESLYFDRPIYVSDLYTSGLGSKSTIVTRIQLMIEDGIFSKSPSSNDGRRQGITLTESFSARMDKHICDSVIEYRNMLSG